MLISQGLWDQLAIDNIADGMVRLWYSLEEFARNIGPGTLLIFAMGGGAVYYFVVRPR
jgi:hypothetical protein